MKKLFVAVTAMIFLSLLSTGARAQRWLSARGFWVVESNIHTPEESTIYFYNNDKQLVYKEHIRGKLLDLSRRKVRKRLERVLDQAVTAYEKDHLMREEDGHSVDVRRLGRVGS